MSRPPILLSTTLVILSACQPGSATESSGSSDSSTASDSTASESTTTTTTTVADGTADDTAGGTGPTGPCPLEGMFLPCTDDGSEGVAYCDEIDGVLMWGPCVVSPVCELGENLMGCQSCGLVEGVPAVTGSPTCQCEGEDGLPVCEQTECVQRWDYSCGSCQSFTGGTCFSYDQGCSQPWLGCALDSPCPRVWAQSGDTFDQLATLEDEAAAQCVLTSLRDGVPGTYRILWGEMGDGGWVQSYVYSGGDGTVVTEWTVDCPGCQNFGRIGRTGVLPLQPATWFDDCLADPTAETLIQCTVGFLQYEPEQPPPEGYVHPFTTGECDSLDALCP